MKSEGGGREEIFGWLRDFHKGRFSAAPSNGLDSFPLLLHLDSHNEILLGEEGTTRKTFCRSQNRGEIRFVDDSVLTSTR